MREAFDPQWYALRVVPQKEYVVAHLLERRADVFAYVPTSTYFRRRTRYSKADAEYARPELPGCIFARFPGTPAWYDVLKNHLILAPIGRDGRPWQFRPAELFGYFARIPNGTLIVKRHDAPQVNVAGRLLRAPTTQVKTISKRKVYADIAEPTAQEAAMLQGLVAAPDAALFMAA